MIILEIIVIICTINGSRPTHHLANNINTAYKTTTSKQTEHKNKTTTKIINLIKHQKQSIPKVSDQVWYQDPKKSMPLQSHVNLPTTHPHNGLLITSHYVSSVFHGVW